MGLRRALLKVGDTLASLKGLAAGQGVTLPDSVIEIFANWPRYELILAALAAKASGGVPAGDTQLLAPLLYPGKDPACRRQLLRPHGRDGLSGRD